MVNNRKSLLSLTVIYTIGNLSSKLISFLLVFFTTYFLSREEVGQFDLILITVNLLLPIVSFQLSDASLRWLLDAKIDIERKRGAVSTIFFFLIFSLTVFSFGYQIYNHYNPSPYSSYLNILLILQVFYIFLQQTIRGMGLNKLYASNSVINAIIYCSLVIGLLKNSDLRLEALLISNIVALAVTASQLVLRARLYSYIKFKYSSVSQLRSFLSYSIPLMPNSLSWWAISSSNRYLILSYVGAVGNGIFAISYKIPTIMTMLLGIFSLAWQEKSILSYEDDERDNYYSSVFKKYLKIVFSISFLIVAVNQPFIKYSVSDSFFESYQYTPILILSTILSSICGFYGTGFLGAKKTRGLLISSIIGGVVTILFSFLLIPLIGLFGAAFSIVIGYFALLIIRIIDSRKFFRLEFPIKDFIGYLLIYLVITLLGYIENIYFIIINVLIASLSVFLLNKTMIYKGYAVFLKKIKSKK
ncbi:lipopolysaccharide biosynthesis protein [Sphingobacterium griseoflavum]|uniref:lipopolysaccharide biosynthesis protein n=1 Tax=Sphingobacterium griseoflavum TaxID=1474952 RepID=UPI001E598BE1|nr:oligosaccharide flippase family protein [Sphingobacterium griseoflavum]